MYTFIYVHMHNSYIGYVETESEREGERERERKRERVWELAKRH